MVFSPEQEADLPSLGPQQQQREEDDENKTDDSGTVVAAAAATAPDVKDAAAAILCGDVYRVSVFLRRLLPEGAKRGGAEQKCMKRALSVLDSKWKTHEEAKRKAMFASEDAGMTDAVFMGGVYLPSDSFAAVVEGMGWQDLVTQLKMITASNPHRVISRVTLGYKIKIGSLGNLSSASGGMLTHLDMTCSKGAKNLDFALMARQLPNLKGLAVEETFYRHEYVYGWLRGLAKFVHGVSLESLRLNVHEFSCWPDDDPSSRAKWRSQDVSKISDSTLEDLANMGQLHTDFSLHDPGDTFNLVDMIMNGGSGSGFADVISHGRATAVVRRHSGGGKNNMRKPPISPPSTLRKLWLSAPLDGPNITAGMGALGSGMPNLEELVMDRLKVTDEGWKKFAMARIEANAAMPAVQGISNKADGSVSGIGVGASRNSAGSRPTSVLRRIRIQTNGSRFVPSAATRGLLEDAVSESVHLYVDSRCREPPAARAASSVLIPSAGGTSGRGGASSGRSGSGWSASGDSADVPVVVDCEGAVLKLDVDGGRMAVEKGSAGQVVAGVAAAAGAGSSGSGSDETTTGQSGSWARMGAAKKLHISFNPWRLSSGLDAGDL